MCDPPTASTCTAPSVKRVHYKVGVHLHYISVSSGYIGNIDDQCRCPSIKEKDYLTINYKEEMEPVPRPAVRRRKRRERDFRRIRNEERREIRNEERRKDVNEDSEGFDWLAGGEAGGANRESEVRKLEFHVLLYMVHLLKLE